MCSRNARPDPRADTKNTFFVKEVKAGTWDTIHSGSVARPAWIPANKMLKYISSEKKTTEFGTKIDMTKARAWVFAKPSETNKWGHMKGYKIVPGKVATQVLPDSEFLLNATNGGGAAAWTKYHLAVTRVKDTERFSVGDFDTYSRSTAEVSLDNFLDGESIENEDIVAWVSTGFVHMPRAEDSPVTNLHYSSFFVQPVNFFDENPAMDVGTAAFIRGPSDAGASGIWHNEEPYSETNGPALGDDVQCELSPLGVQYQGDAVAEH